MDKIQIKISELQGVLTSIENIQNNIHDAKVSTTFNDVYQKEISERYIITMPFDKSANPDGIQNDYAKLDILVEQINGIATYESGILFELYENEAIPNCIYTTIAKPVNHPSYKHIAEGSYICVNYDKKSYRMSKKIMKYIAKHNLTPKE